MCAERIVKIFVPSPFLEANHRLGRFPYDRRFMEQSASLRRGPGLRSILVARRPRSAIACSRAAQGKDADACRIAGVVGRVTPGEPTKQPEAASLSLSSARHLPGSPHTAS